MMSWDWFYPSFCGDSLVVHELENSCGMELALFHRFSRRNRGVHGAPAPLSKFLHGLLAVRFLCFYLLMSDKPV